MSVKEKDMALKDSRQTASWQQHIMSHQESGLSRSEYCKKHGLKVHRLTYQIQRQKKLGGAVKPSAFARVVVSQPPIVTIPGAYYARLLLAGGTSLELGPTADPVWIAKLLIQLKGLL
jgi:hypothetical protein